MPTLLWLITQRKLRVIMMPTLSSLTAHEAVMMTTSSAIKDKQRQTRTPAFWEYLAASWLPILLIHIGSQVKTRPSQIYKKFAKNSNFGILQIVWHAKHQKLLDKMCKYEMDLASIVEDTKWTRFCPQTDGGTDGQRETSIAPFQLRWSGGYNKVGIITIFSSLTTIGFQFQWLLL